MDVHKALEIIEANKSRDGELIYNEKAAAVLLGHAEEDLAALKPEDDGFEAATKTKNKMIELLEAFKAVDEYNKTMLTTFPLLFSLSDLMHPEEGVIITPIEEGLSRVNFAGNWPADMPPFAEVLDECTARLQSIRTQFDERKPQLTDYIPPYLFVVVVGNANSHPLLQQRNNIKKPEEPAVHLALGIPNLV